MHNKTQRYGLPVSPYIKNVNYTEEQLGFSRRYKGREVYYQGIAMLITYANRHRVILQRDQRVVTLSYPEFHQQCTFIKQPSAVPTPPPIYKR